jgi:flavin-binding protein dodecin
MTTLQTHQEIDMKKKASSSKSSVYRITELVGTSPNSWEEAASNAVKTASSTLRDMRVAEITKLDVVVDDNGKVSAFRARVNLSFKYEK